MDECKPLSSGALMNRDGSGQSLGSLGSDSPLVPDPHSFWEKTLNRPPGNSTPEAQV